MRRIGRLFVTLMAATAIVAAGLSAVVATGVAVISHATSAQALPLPPLAPAPLVPSTVYAADGTTVLAVFHASARRLPVSFSQVSKTLVNAVLDTEDARFYIHGGFDVPSTVRAVASDSSAGGGVQGGSTITQQLVKQAYLTSQRKVSRKIKEAVLADRLQKKYTKDQILEAYLNTIYLGNGAYGVQAAANTYFNVDVSSLNVPQAAMLAGLIQNPNGYDPLLDPAPARTRRAQVLSRMVHYRTITQAQADAANATPLPTAVTVPSSSSADATNNDYVREVETELLGSNSPLGASYTERYNALFEGGLKITTNLDASMQTVAEHKTAQDTPANDRGFEQAEVSIESGTGKVRALVGGANSSQFDIITQGSRQPGSGFKIFTLLAALEKGYNPTDTINGSSPCAIDFPTNHDLVNIAPAHNDEGAGGGVETLLVATAQSTNCAFIRLAHEVGLPSVVDMAHRLGITENVPLFPSVVIGATAVHPLEMAAAYAALANDGMYHAPSFIDHIVDHTGTTSFTGGDPGHRVVSSQVARQANQAFMGVLVSGTAAGKGLGRPAAGKTGTTENSDDAWFNGYTPGLETTVWMGSAAGETPMTDVGGLSSVFGGTFPATTWQDIMSAIVAPQTIESFLTPDSGGSSKYIDSAQLQKDDRSAGAFYNPTPRYRTRR
ncbi:MAG: penicillin-binding protein [Actinomycetota bacterium]|nr:penicillin-binding protein [Actinomycetota bacterium]